MTIIDDYINMSTIDGGTNALLFACYKGSKETIDVLINECKVNVAAKDIYGAKAIDYINVSNELKKWVENQVNAVNNCK